MVEASRRASATAGFTAPVSGAHGGNIGGVHGYEPGIDAARVSTCRGGALSRLATQPAHWVQVGDRGVRLRGGQHLVSYTGGNDRGADRPFLTKRVAQGDPA